MRRNPKTRLEWGREMARRRENARLRRVVRFAEPIRDVVEIAGALVWDRAWNLSIVKVLHDSQRRTYDVEIATRGKPLRRMRGIGKPGCGRIMATKTGRQA